MEPLWWENTSTEVLTVASLKKIDSFELKQTNKQTEII